MQWRMLARRCPTASMTIVGDLGQASRPGAIRSWAEALAQLPARREPRLLELTVNYRTPTEIMELAAAVLEETDPGLDPPRSVRRSGVSPRIARVAQDDLVPAEVADHVARLHSELGEGKIAVIAPTGRLSALRSALNAQGDVDVSDSSDPLAGTVGLFAPTEAKGLEFDAVVLVEPSELAGGSVAGLRGLYVALTRATRFLAIVHHRPLPSARSALTSAHSSGSSASNRGSMVTSARCEERRSSTRRYSAHSARRIRRTTIGRRALWVPRRWRTCSMIRRNSPRDSRSVVEPYGTTRSSDSGRSRSSTALARSGTIRASPLIRSTAGSSSRVARTRP